MPVPVYKPTELPPGPGRRSHGKPPYELAGRREEIAFFAEAGRISGNIAATIIDAEATSAVAAFQDSVKTKFTELDTWVKGNPGKSEEEYRQRTEETFTDLKKLGANTKGPAKHRIGQFWQANEKNMKAEAEARVDSIRLERELEQAEVHWQNAVSNEDIPQLQVLAKKYYSGGLWDKEMARLRLEGAIETTYGEVAIRTALANPDEEAGLASLDKINSDVRAKYSFMESDLYGPAEIDELKQRYERTINAEQAEANRQRTVRADAFERETSLSIRDAKLTDETGKPLSEAIRGNLDITPEKMDKLLNRYDARVKSLLPENREYTATEVLAAFRQVREAPDQDAQLEALAGNAEILGPTEVKSLYDDITTGQMDDPVRKGMFEAIDYLHKFKQKGAEDLPTATKTATRRAELEVERARLEIQTLEQDRRLLGEGAGPQQRLDAAEALRKPAQEKAAANWWSRAWAQIGGRAAWPYGPLPGRTKKKKSASVDLSRMTMEELLAERKKLTNADNN